ncbi:hypothetical protein [Salinispora cortesiana]|uniref:hypothetical protein n=1 Tax=Salinispora cortesiana TaxID=1305843 RepID=UPI001FDF014B|nr:hypothetical protein [Salinispora cortesiana]
MLLATVFEFDTSRGDEGADAALSSSQPLERIAGDFTGGTFFRCGRSDEERPVLYASSEGQAGLIADTSREALELVIGLPYWRDCLNYSGSGNLKVMTTAAAYLQRDLVDQIPEIALRQSEAANYLSLEVVPANVLLARLHAAVSRSDPDYVYIDETGEYEGLFGAFRPDRNPRWR